MNIILKFLICFLLCVSLALASIDVEMEGLEAISRDDGTFLVASPMYYFDRPLGASGVHSESEIWSPQKIRERLLFNRFSILPSWEVKNPSIWIKSGNELGDMIYQDFITVESRPGNRTPILEGGFRSPSYKGFWVTFRAFQDDHYSSRTMNVRSKWVDDSFSLFGENYPLFSSAYAGLGYTKESFDAHFLVGEEYLWLFSESSRWIPVHYKPRIETSLDLNNLSVMLTFMDGYYQNKNKKEKGNRKETSGSIYYKCDRECQNEIFNFSFGTEFRIVSDSGLVYSELDNNRVIWPFLQFSVQPIKRLTANVSFGANNDDWLIQDSIEFNVAKVENFGAVLGIKNISGTRLNPLADDVEFFDDFKINLFHKGQMNLLQSYVGFADSLEYVGIGGRMSLWAEHGAESFDTTQTIEDKNLIYRKGNVSRINSWIKGLTGEFWISASYKEMFDFKALAGFERLDGGERLFEVTPAEFFVSFSADWILFDSFRISQSLRYRSDAEWNLRGPEPLVVKGDWFWDATFEQMFPKQKLFLTGSILHILANESLQVPNGGFDRIRFICMVKKLF